MSGIGATSSSGVSWRRTGVGPFADPRLTPWLAVLAATRGQPAVSPTTPVAPAPIARSGFGCSCPTRNAADDRPASPAPPRPAPIGPNLLADRRAELEGRHSSAAQAEFNDNFAIY